MTLENTLAQTDLCFQKKYSPKSICFGCGPINSLGLHVETYYRNNRFEAIWEPSSHHQAFPGMLNGGIIGSLLDCHSNCTAAITLMNHLKLDSPPCTVTAYFNVKLLRPTPIDQPIMLIANPIKILDDRVEVSAELVVGDKVYAKCDGLFVAVKPGHPAYHQW